MMNIKYFILFCATLYTPAVSFRYTEEEILGKWNQLRTPPNQYITLMDLKRYLGEKVYSNVCRTEAFRKVIDLGDGRENDWKLYFHGFVSSLSINDGGVAYEYLTSDSDTSSCDEGTPTRTT